MVTSSDSFVVAKAHNRVKHLLDHTEVNVKSLTMKASVGKGQEKLLSLVILKGEKQSYLSEAGKCRKLI